MTERDLIRVEKSDLPSLAVVENLLREYPATKASIIAASGRETSEICDFLSARLKRAIKFDSTTPTPLRNMYKSPETLGLDRLAGAIGANLFFPGENLLLFSFGTALTIDFVADNRYLGGNISPGLQLRFRALHEFTAKLPLCAPPLTCTPARGGTTSEAIESGVLIGMISEVRYYIDNYKGYKAIFSGGDASYFAGKIKVPIFVFSNSVLYGLNEVLKYNIFNNM
jgi:type III pantothenate kinase